MSNTRSTCLRQRLIGLAAASVLITFGAGVVAAPAAATSKIEKPEDEDCRSVASVNGCLFTGNIGPATVAETQAVYRRFARDKRIANPDITLAYLFKSDDSDFAGTVTGSDTAGGWSTPGYRVDFIAVKAANNFVLYQLPVAASSGLWSTIDIPHRRNSLKALSHIAFFGAVAASAIAPNPSGVPSAVPEPASWAMLIAGMGLVGINVRRRRRLASVAA